MSKPQSTTSNAPTHGSTAGAGAAESVKGTVHHIQGMGDAIRGNAMDFVDTMFGTPRQPGESRVGTARAGEDVTRGPGERATAGDAPRRTDDVAARAPMSTSAANNANDAQTRSSESQPATTTGFTTESGIAGKSGRPAEDAPTQGPPALPPRDV